MNDSTIRLLLATDNHLGYLEKDPIRGNDSFETFEEILLLAKAHKVDAILLGGDLFHENKPSRKTLYKTMELLREHCLSNEKCYLRMLSDQSTNFPNRFARVNYEDEFLNVGMPIFSIHGNHDDPQGDGKLCSLDLLSIVGLVNYFGNSQNMEHIKISPLLFSKQNTYLAVYGLGSIRDERLHRTFQQHKVEMLRPDTEGEIDRDDWFSLFVLHQNRSKHGETNYIPEEFIHPFLDLVFWGHEHECLIQPVHTNRNFHIIQPGSSVATSLSEGEAKPKHVGLLSITEKSYSLEALPLKTIRPFIMKTVILKNSKVDSFETQKVQQYLIEQVEEMIEEVPDHEKLPLIRLKVEYSGGYTPLNPQRFGQKFVNRVANPKDILLFYRSRASADRANSPTKKKIQMDPVALHPEMANINVEHLVEQHLRAQQLGVLNEQKLIEAVKLFVDKDDKDAIKEFIDGSLKKKRAEWFKRQQEASQGHLPEEVVEVEDDQSVKEMDVDETLKEKSTMDDMFMAEPPPQTGTKKRTTKRGKKSSSEEEEEVMEVQSKRRNNKKKKMEESEEDDGFSDDENLYQKPKSTATTKSKSSARRRQPVSEDDDDDEIIDISDSEESETFRPKKVGRKPAATKRTTKRR